MCSQRSTIKKGIINCSLSYVRYKTIANFCSITRKGPKKNILRPTGVALRVCTRARQRPMLGDAHLMDENGVPEQLLTINI